MISASLLAVGLTAQAPNDYWGVVADIAQYGPVDIELSNNQVESVFKFNVTPRPDGSLPMVQTHVANTFRSENHFALLKKQPSGKYALHAVIRPNVFRLGKEKGLLLPPGDYAYHAPPVSGLPTAWHGATLISGRWVSGAIQNELWQVQATTFPSMFPTIGGGSDTGYRFTVEARKDGKQLLLEQSTCQVSTSITELCLYRKNPSGEFYIWTSTVSSSQPGVAVLPAGDYAIRSGNGDWWLHNRSFMIIASGRWIEP